MGYAFNFQTNVNRYCKFEAEDMQIIGTFCTCLLHHPLFEIFWHQKSSTLLIAKINTPFFHLIESDRENWIEWEKCAKMGLNGISTFFTLNCACDTRKGIYCFLRQLASHALIHILNAWRSMPWKIKQYTFICTYIDNTFLLSI